MFEKKEDVVGDLLEDTIINVLEQMKLHDVDSPEYAKHRKELERVYALRDASPEPVSRNTILMVVGNLTGIALIILFEERHVMTSKALNYLPAILKR